VDSVAEVKQRISLTDLVGRTVKLQKSGRNHRGLCPFHTEKTPSFYVFEDSATWRCFGSCGEGGDVFSFLQKKENMDFRDALEVLAREAGVQLVSSTPENLKEKDRLKACLAVVVEFYKQNLKAPSGEIARQYLTENRGVSNKTIEHFQLGWASDEWGAIRKLLKDNGFTDEEGLAVGVLAESDRGSPPYDRFRGRIIFPILDNREVLVGLGGRILGEGEPKYLNSPQTKLFDKGNILYGLNDAAKPAKESGVIILVEGYFDVISAWQAGFMNVVATMGTSLTEMHSRVLSRSVNKVILALDPDIAGQNAIERAGQLVLNMSTEKDMRNAVRSVENFTGNSGLDLYVALLPDGQDPDLLVRENTNAWKKSLETASPFINFMVNRIIDNEPLSTPQEASRLIDRIKPILGAIRDPVIRGRHIQDIARRLGLHEEYVNSAVKSRSKPPGTKKSIAGEVILTAHEVLLSTMLQNAGLRDEMENLPLDLFTNSIDREVFRNWLSEPILSSEDSVDSDLILERREYLFSRRAPKLDLSEVKKRARDLIKHILRERLVQRQLAVTQEVAAAEVVHGIGEVQKVAHDAWLGHLPRDTTVELAETVIEELELGLSLHRQEDLGADIN
jgi:DNA primase